MIEHDIAVTTGDECVIHLNEQIRLLRKCSENDCSGCAGEDCSEHMDRLMREAADALEVLGKELEQAEPDRTGQNRTYTTPEIIRLVQRVVSDATCGMDSTELCIAYEVERGIVAELMEGEKDGSNI